MRIEGKRIKQTRLIQRGRFVVAVEVEAVIPRDDPSEPCYEHETIEFLREVADHADHNDLNWLKRHGTIYQRLINSDPPAEGEQQTVAG